MDGAAEYFYVPGLHEGRSLAEGLKLGFEEMRTVQLLQAEIKLL